MNNFKATSPATAFTALVLSFLITATTLMTYTQVSVSDIRAALTTQQELQA